MILPEISELAIVGVFDRGVPNKERIVLVAREYVNAGAFVLFLGLRGNQGDAYPIRNNMLYLGDAVLSPNDLVLVYTGPGEAKATKVPNNDGQLYTCHWGYKTTVLHNADIIPMLVRMDGVQNFVEPAALPPPKPTFKPSTPTFPPATPTKKR